jgi:hypothetical protein
VVGNASVVSTIKTAINKTSAPELMLAELLANQGECAAYGCSAHQSFVQ